ncbi:MAG TPA: polymer-forming cytoskeletal protein [Candidatus Kapabacteria bacterium]|nr:polymer-forming cytoskeletal protein [Candidatus Kapabacteria bacterium]
MRTTISKNFAGLKNNNGVYHYTGDLEINSDCCVDGDLVVTGNLTCHKDIKVLGNIRVYGNLTASNVSADVVTVDGDVLVNENLDVEQFNVRGNITVNGNLKTRLVSQCYGNLTTYNLVSDNFFYIGGNINIKGKAYAPLQEGLF